MKKKNPLVTTSADYGQIGEGGYIPEKQLKTFQPSTKSVSTVVQYHAVTWKKTGSDVSDIDYSPHFDINLKKVSREEATYRLNEKLNRRRIIENSTSSE